MDWAYEQLSAFAMAFCRVLGLLQNQSIRRSLLSTGDVYSFLIDSSSASNKAVTTSYLTLGEVRDPSKLLRAITILRVSCRQLV